MKFKSDIEVQAGLKDSSGALGLSGQILSSTSGNVSWVTPTVNTVARDVQNEVKAGVAINKGQAVYVTGADGTNIIVGLASNATEATSSKTLGLLNATVAVNGFADVVQIGRLSGLNTLGATAGDPVWLGTGGNLIYGLINKPYAPANLVFIGIVTRVNVNNGEIFVNVQNGFELNEIHDVDLKTTVPINGDILGYDGTLWVNKTIAQWLGYTPANASGTTNYVSKFTGTTTLGNSQLFDNGTSVGIGTTTPTKKLDVNGGLVVGMEPAPFWNAKFKDYSDGSAIYISTVNGGGGKFIAGNAYYNNSLQWWSDKTTASAINLDNGAIVLYTNSGLTPNTNFTPSEKMRVTPGGNVGIGTASPSQKLNIASDGYNFRLSNNTNASGYNIGRNVTDGLLYFYGDQTGYNGFVFSGVDGERMRIDASGNLGLGVTPSSWGILNKAIEGVYGTSYSFDTNIPTAHISSNAFNNGTNWIYKINAPASRYAVVGWTGEHIWYNAPSGTAGNAISFTQAMTLKANGNLGIGTTTPTNRLHVLGGILNGAIATFSGQNLDRGLVVSTFNSGNSDAGVLLNAQTALGVLAFATVGSERMRITSGGNVGIGTSSPNAALDIIKTSNAAGLNVQQNGNIGEAAAYMYGQYYGLSLGVNSTTSSYYAFSVRSGVSTATPGFTGGNSLFYVGADGNVGIGDAAPSDKLVVNGRARINGTNALAFGNNAGGYAQIAVSGATTGNLLFSTYDGSALGERMRISTTGNVGIGTSSPNFKLEVNGSVHVGNSSASASGFSNAMEIVNTASSPTSLFLYQLGIGSGHIGLRSNDSNLYIVNSYTDGSITNPSAITLTPSGSVGIGNTSPSFKLDVNGTGRFAQNQNGITSVITQNNDLTNGAGQAFRFYFDGSTPIGGIFNQYNTSTFAYDLAFQLWNGTSATNRLTINGSTGAIKFNAYGSGTFTGTATQKLAVDSSGNIIEIPIGAGPVDGSGTTNYVTKWTDADTIGNSQIFDNGTNVGIGTVSPSQKLDVIGNLSLRAVSNVDGAFQKISFPAGIYEKAEIRGYSTGTTDAGALAFLTAPAGDIVLERMRIDSLGNVGIGTISPAERLSIAAGTSTSLGLSLMPSGWNNAKHRFIVPLSGDSSQLSFNWNGSTRDYSGYGSSFIGLAQDVITFNNSLGDPLERMRITSAGDVAIGTSSAFTLGGTAKLSVYASGPSTFGLSNTDAVYLRRYGTGQYQFQTSANGGNSGDLSLQSYGGNVGIGTTGPVEKLHVVSTSAGAATYPIAIQNADSTIGTEVGIKFIAAGATTRYAAIEGIQEDGNNSIGLGFTTGQGATITEKMRIIANGNVGIGTITPSQKLSVSGNISLTTGGYIYGDTTTPYLRLSQTNGSFLVYGNSGIGLYGSLADIYSSDRITLQTNGSERMRISNTGNVGIGTTNPTYKLHVIGNSFFESGFSTYTADGLFSANARPGVWTKTPGATERGVRLGYRDFGSGEYFGRLGFVGISNWSTGISNSAGTSFSIGLNNATATDYLTITDTGNVGIGTTAPNAKLEVSAGQSFINQDYLLGWNVAGSATLRAYIIGTSGNELQFWNRQGGINTQAITLNASGNVGIGTTAPTQKLDVVGAGKFSSSVQVGDDSATASATNVGATRYRSDANNSYMDMVMQTGASTYAWVNVVQNNW